MAEFIKKNWQCEDIITADDLNRLEEGVEEALSGGDKGYSCTEGWVTLTDESVTTAIVGSNPFARGDFTYSEPITADIIKVTFNGTEYTCNKKSVNDTNAYGGVDAQGPLFSEYPFAIIPSQSSNRFFTETAGTYRVKIETREETIETSECFKKAVESVRAGAFQVRAVSRDAETGVITYNCSVSQLRNAFERGDYITFCDELSDTPLMLRDCVFSRNNNQPTLVGMIGYTTSQATASNSQVISMMIAFNEPSSDDEMLTRGDGK